MILGRSTYHKDARYCHAFNTDEGGCAQVEGRKDGRQMKQLLFGYLDHLGCETRRKHSSPGDCALNNN